MRVFIFYILAILAEFFAQSVQATPIYLIDSSQSYVSAYVPEWTAYSYTPPYIIDPNTPPPDPTILWALNWTLENFQLSGYFQGIIQISPYNPAWAHLTISNQNLHNQLPSYLTQSFELLGQVTYSVSDGFVTQTNFCSGDPYYPWLPSGACIWTGPPPYLSGTFDGETLDIAGGSGGLPPVDIIAGGVYPSQQINDPGPPPPLDPSQSPTTWASYRIVATTIPEPGTFYLFLIGGFAFIIRSAKYRCCRKEYIKFTYP